MSSNSPAAHRHSPPPVRAAHVCVHAALPARELVPPAHASHAAPPASALYEPAAQSAQAAAGPVKPGFHWQVVPPGLSAALGLHRGMHSEAVSAPVGAVSPGGQKLH